MSKTARCPRCKCDIGLVDVQSPGAMLGRAAFEFSRDVMSGGTRRFDSAPQSQLAGVAFRPIESPSGYHIMLDDSLKLASAYAAIACGSSTLAAIEAGASLLIPVAIGGIVFVATSAACIAFQMGAFDNAIAQVQAQVNAQIDALAQAQIEEAQVEHPRISAQNEIITNGGKTIEWLELPQGVARDEARQFARAAMTAPGAISEALITQNSSLGRKRYERIRNAFIDCGWLVWKDAANTTLGAKVRAHHIIKKLASEGDR